MEIGTEISHKIRSAIKAKLVDLGAYVDDELPDYIMVMVANKKTGQQMANDLNLFLGSNTDAFTSWLHALLTKLQSITADPPKPDAVEEIESNGNDLENKNEKSSEAEPTVDEEEPLLNLGTDADEFEEENRKAEEAAKISATPKKQNKVTPQIRAGIDKTAKEELQKTLLRIGVTAPTRQMKEVTTRQTKEVTTRPTKEVTTRQTKEETARPTKEVAARPTKEVTTTRSLASRLGNRVTTRNSRDSGIKRSSSGGAVDIEIKRRRAPESVLASVIKHDIEDKEEGYNPHRPSIGNVASVVRVTARKSSIPPALQANKSLLVRAMSEAEESVEKTNKRYGTERAIVKPVQKMHADGYDRGHSQGSRNGRSYSQSDRHRPRSDPHKEQRSIQLFSKSKRLEVFGRLQASVDSDQDSETSGKGDAYTAAIETEEYMPVSFGDSRQVECSSNDSSQSNNVVEHRRITCETTDGGTEVVLEENLEYEDRKFMAALRQVKKETKDLNNKVSRIIRNGSPPLARKERAESPKFVVTLDGVNPREMKTSNPTEVIWEEEEEEDLNETEEVEGEKWINEDSGKNRELTKTVGRVKPQNHITFDLEGDVEMQEEAMEMDDSPKVLERCRFWPGCKNGDECQFHHPTVQCVKFPNCKFADKCLYIHPNCRFDAKCSRPNCPYTHASKRSQPQSLPVILQPIEVPVYGMGAQRTSTPARSAVPSINPTNPKKMKCKFFPTCTNMNCPYNHPKACRFGISCRDIYNCSFSHPALPSKSALKWTAASKTDTPSHISDRPFSATAVAQKMPTPVASKDDL